jgi:hypothetical protein
MWLEDLLPTQVPESRIMLFEYNSSSDGVDNIFDPNGFKYAAGSLLEQLLVLRNGTKVNFS